MYTINQEALHDIIISKKNKGRHILNFSEWANVIANLTAGGFLLYSTLTAQQLNISFFILGGLMIGVGLFVFIGRLKRYSQPHNYDQTIVGDLKEALADSQFQVYLSQLLRWYLLPISILVLGGLGLDDSSSILFLSLAIIFFAAIYWFSQWEHRYYVNRRDELKNLMDTLKKNDTSPQN